MMQRVTCPITGAPTEVVFTRPYTHPVLREILGRVGWADRFADRAYEIRYAPDSDLYFQTWVMDGAELGAWYSPPADAEFFAQAIAAQKLHWFAHQTEEILVLRQLCPRPRPAVLDFGCNWGKWSSMALAHGCEVFGVEINRDAAAFCAARGIHMLTQAELGTDRFDFINVDQVMEHLSEPLPVARLLAQALRPGGWIKFSTPENPGLAQRMRAAQATGADDLMDAGTLDSLLPLEHVNLFSGRSLRALARAAGLTPYRLPFWKWLGAGQLWNMPRQFNRNVIVPWKRWRGRSTYQWFQKPI